MHVKVNMILGTLTCLSLIGCASSENELEIMESSIITEEEANKEEFNEYQSTQAAEEYTEDESITDKDIQIKPKIFISQKAYDSLVPVNEKYIIFRENEKYGVIDFEENIILPAEYDRLWPINNDEKYLLFEEDEKYGVIDYEGNVVLAAEYNYCDNTLENGAIKFSKVISDGIESVLYDADMNILFTNTEYPEYQIVSYYEDVLCMKNSDWTSAIYLDGAKGFEEIIVMNDSTLHGFMYANDFHNNYATIFSKYYYAEKTYANLLDRNGNLLCLSTDKYDIVTPWEGQYINNDGWTICTLWDKETETEVTDDEQVKDIHFYNVKTNDLVDCPFSSVYRQSEEKNGTSFETVIVDGFVVGTNDFVEGKKGCVCTYTSTDETEKYVYDIVNQKYMTTEPYSYISLEKQDEKYLYSNMEGKWGYLDEEFKPLGDIYDDASAFLNGYAAINENGEEYIIDSNFEKITEPIPGDSAYVTDYYIAISKEGKYYFVVVR